MPLYIEDSGTITYDDFIPDNKELCRLNFQLAKNEDLLAFEQQENWLLERMGHPVNRQEEKNLEITVNLLRSKAKEILEKEKND